MISKSVAKSPVAADEPKECLIVERFLSIQKAEIDVRRFTVIIGPQASGKSLLAKLLYFFRRVYSRHFFDGIAHQQNWTNLTNACLDDFRGTFPNYSWKNSDFQISYQLGDSHIRVRPIVDKKESDLEIQLSGDLRRKYQELLKSGKMRDAQDKDPAEMEYRSWQRLMDLRLSLSKTSSAFVAPTFIPANRAFFATLQQSVFTFLAQNLPIDPLIKEFGSVYEFAKRSYLYRDRYHPRKNRKLNELTYLLKEVQKILSGEYKRQGEEDFIVSRGRTVNLVHASSGQQESLPMLLVLLRRAIEDDIYAKAQMIFVEEPETHLFPTSQRELVGIFSVLYAKYSSQFFLTTHSPYVLTAINNLAFASKVYVGRNKTREQKVKDALNGASSIQTKHLSAYAIEDGRSFSIIDKNSGIIGSSVIDEVSDHFETVLENLIQLDYESKK
ncbi:MAG: ATP-binding protein [Candidatus Obscuribacterales bacterium]|nr:ATP-binding protein [Candidatus Obscuribacterales bacterium]